MHSAITGMHYCVPTRRLTNDELVERFGERQVKSIVKMAGVTERRVVGPGETASDLAYWAAVRLLEDRHVDPASVDLIVFASQTGDYQLPATACVLHGRLGLSERCAAFDLNLGCTSFPYSLAVVHGMIAGGMAKRALLLNAEALTSVIHPKDRGLVPLHGDGASATLVEATAGDHGVEGVFLGTDGTGYHHLIIPASGARMPRSAETCVEETNESGIVRTKEHLHMNGAAIFHFSVYKIPEVITQALESFKLTIDDLDLVILHQANRTMVTQIYRALGVPAEKQFMFMEMIGNLSGPSTPVVLAEAWRQGRIRPGSRTLLCAFGVGLSWGVVTLKWPDTIPPAVAAPVEPGEAAA